MVVKAGSLTGAGARRGLSQQALRNLEGWLFILPVVIGVLGFYLIPIGVSLYTSFTNWDGLTAHRLIGFDNYERILLNDQVYRKVLGNTLYYVAGHIPLTILVALGLALLCHRPMRGVTWYRASYFTPAITNVVAIGLVWSYFYAPKVGVLNGLLALVGIEGPSWLADVRWAMPAVILLSVWQGVGYPMVILLAGLNGIPEMYYDAAKIDGAGAWQRFRHVTLPLLTPVFFFLIITQFISSFQVFGSIFVLTHGGPANATNVYSYYVFQNAFQFSKMGYAAALAWLLFLIIATITVLQWRLQKHWVFYN
jgi:multiple sugar transport system permease protein